MPVNPSEDILRAVCTNQWDAATQRLSPSLFKGENTSVSRLTITSLEDHWEVFRLTVERPPDRRLELITQINVGALQKIGQKYQTPTNLTVEPKPERNNPAHAEIPQTITKGLSRVIVSALTRHFPPA
jgi:hypothetical protein